MPSLKHERSSGLSCLCFVRVCVCVYVFKMKSSSTNKTINAKLKQNEMEPIFDLIELNTTNWSTSLRTMTLKRCANELACVRISVCASVWWARVRAHRCVLPHVPKISLTSLHFRFFFFIRHLLFFLVFLFGVRECFVNSLIDDFISSLRALLQVPD